MLPVSFVIVVQRRYTDSILGGTDKQSVINAAGKFALQYYLKQQTGMGGMGGMMGGGSSGGGGGASGLMSLASKFLK